MKAQFTIKESFRLINRSKFTFLITVLLCAVGSILSSGLIGAYQVSFYVESEARQTFKLNVFLADSVTDSQIDEVKRELRILDPGAQFQMIDKQQALDKFVRETGEEIGDVLDFNPFPITLVTTLKSSSLANISSESIRQRISLLQGVEDTQFEKDLLMGIIGYIQSFRGSALWIIGMISFLICLLIYGAVLNISKLAIHDFNSISFVTSGPGGGRWILVAYLLIISVSGTVVTSLVVAGTYHLVQSNFGIDLKEFIPIEKVALITGAVALGFCLFGGLPAVLRLRSQNS